MYQIHPDINTPKDETVLWRYLSMEKLLALCSSKELHLTRLDKFTDPWEGAWPKTFLAALNNNASNFTAENFIPTIAKLKRTFYVNCWHGSLHESAALWDQYSGRAGFAIKTTVEALKKSTETDLLIYLGVVNYTDYEFNPQSHGILNALKPAFMKRKSFEHEREVRLMHWLPSNMDPVEDGGTSSASSGIGVPVNLNTLIHELYVSPAAPTWLIGHVSNLLEAFGVHGIPVHRSTLYDPHVY